MGVDSWYYETGLAQCQKFHEIRNANGEVAAVFGIGANTSSYTSSHFALTASMSAEGVEILTSDELASNEVQGSIDFV